MTTTFRNAPDLMHSPAAMDLDVWSHHSWTDGLQVEGLQALDSLVVRTLNSTYEITVLAPRLGDVLVRGGRFFPEFAPARLAGASLGGSFLKERGIYLGFCMELHDGTTNIVTTSVQSIARVQPSGVQ